MALASLIPHHIFGLRSNLKNVLYFSDDSTVLYPAGHNLVFWSTDQKSQRIISGSPDTDTISAVAVSANRKQVAIAEYSSLLDKANRRGSGADYKPSFSGAGAGGGGGGGGGGNV